MVGQVFTAGDIDYRMFQTIVCRSDLTVDGEVLAPWPPSSLSGRLAGVDDPAPAGRPRRCNRGPRRCAAPAEEDSGRSESRLGTAKTVSARSPAACCAPTPTP